MLSFLADFDPQQLNSGIYFAAAAFLIFTAAVLAGRKIHQQLPAPWLIGIAGLALIVFALIWLLLSAPNRKATAPALPPDYPAATGSP